MFLRAAIGPRLKGSDKLLSQVLLVRNLTVRGIAIHHAGMLPLLKEVWRTRPSCIYPDFSEHYVV